MDNGNFVRLLSKADQGQYVQLLRASFSQANNFRAEQTSLQWTKTDDFYLVFGLFHNHKLVSMMRLEWIDSLLELKYKLDEPEGTWNPPLPLGYLAKAATLPEMEGRGFNTVLRYYCLKVFLNWNVKGVVGIMAEGSARLSIMEKMGYKFRFKSGKWNGNFKSDHQILVAYLDGPAAITEAIMYLEKHLSLVIQQYPAANHELQLPKQGRCQHRFPWER